MIRRFFFLSCIACSLFAQQQPLEVISPTVLSHGQAYSSLSFSHYRNATFPLSGLDGSLTKIGTLKFMFSYDGMVELGVDGTMLDLLSIRHRRIAFNSNITSSNNPTGDIGDFTFWTKFFLLSEYRSLVSLSLRFGAQLPNASNESGLGVDETNFYSSFLLQKHFLGVWTLNIGLAILGSPSEYSSQHDMMIYGLKYSVPVAEQTFLVLQTAGRRGHEGTGIYNLANGKLGFEKVFNAIILFGNGILNFAPSDNSYGVELGAGYLFQLTTIN